MRLALPFAHDGTTRARDLVGLMLIRQYRMSLGQPPSRVDERDTMFARMARRQGSPAYEEYYRRRPNLKATDDRLRSPVARPVPTIDRIRGVSARPVDRRPVIGHRRRSP
jgi:hypothetical protein